MELIHKMTSPDDTPLGSGSSGHGHRRHIAFAVWLLVLVAAFCKPLLALAHLSKIDLHSHTLLIPLITGYLLYAERRRLTVHFTTSWPPASALGTVALGLVAAATVSILHAAALGREGPTALLILAFVCLIVAGGFLILGTPWVRAASFPLAFLVFMVPLPSVLAAHLEEGLKLASTDTAEWFFDLVGVPALRDGTFFRLPGITIEVAPECSGIRSTYVLLMTSLVVADLFLRSPWHRAILVAAIVPLGIVRNGFRIVTLGWLCVRVGPHMIHTWIHHRGGPVFFVLSLIPLFLLLYWFWKREHRKPGRTIPI